MGYWKVLSGSPSEAALALYPDLERFDHQRNLELVLAAAPLKPMPLIVLSSDEPYDLTPFVEDGTLPADIAEEFGNILFQAILDARADLLSQVPGARHITDTDSGHYIHREQPQLVSGSVREVAEAVRKKACALGTKNHGQCIKALNHAARRLIVRLEEADLSGGSSERLTEAMVAWGAEGDIRERVREHFGHLIRVTRSDRVSLNS